MNALRCLCLLAALLAGGAGVARAVPVDGVLDPEYGTALAVQTTQTSLGDLPEDWLFGGELDGAFGYVENDTLHLLIAGNFSRFYSEPLVFANQLQLYIDTQPGGQNPLSGANPSVGFFVDLPRMAGLAFDTDFAPDYWLACSRDESVQLHAYYAELPAGGGGAGHHLGASPIGGPGTLSGPGTSNPHGILAAVDISNAAGVTAGCEAASGAGVATGAEWAIPLAALGHPTGAIRICALLANTGWPVADNVSNQLLGPVPPGTCALGPANTVDLANVPGSQFFVVEQITPVFERSWGRLKTLYR